MKSKSKKLIRYFLLGIICLTVLLGFTAYSISHDRKLTFIEKGLRDTVLAIGNVLATPIRFVQEKWSILADNEKIYKDYEDLKKEYTSQEQLQESLKELEIENQKLKQLLDIDHSLSHYEKVHATVISRDNLYWLQSFTIDKGTSDGIEENMAVVGNGGLIGYISSASYHTSTVKLLTNASLENKVSIKIEISQGRYAYGLLSGYDATRGVYYIEGISDYVEIPISATVTTTGLGDRFPDGLVIGTVQDIETDSFDLTKVVYVKPSMNTDDISFVSVLIREEES